MAKLITIAGLMLAFITFFFTSCQHQNIADEVSPVTDPKSSLSSVPQAFPGQVGITKTFTIGGDTITYQEINGVNVLGGDIILAPSQMEDQKMTDGTYRIAASSRWPNKTVYYTINSDLPNLTRVTNAIAYWQANTKLKFVKRTTQNDFVTFRTSEGCWSSIGKLGNQQYIGVGPYCTTGNIIHEIGHTVGLHHEQSRSDRDKYVRINWANIQRGQEYSFKTYQIQETDGKETSGGLDFNSIMMYDSYAASNNNRPTIVKLNGSTFKGNFDVLSPKDKATVALMYP